MAGVVGTEAIGADTGVTEAVAGATGAGAEARGAGAETCAGAGAGREGAGAQADAVWLVGGLGRGLARAAPDVQLPVRAGLCVPQVLRVLPGAAN